MQSTNSVIFGLFLFYATLIITINCINSDETANNQAETVESQPQEYFIPEEMQPAEEVRPRVTSTSSTSGTATSSTSSSSYSTSSSSTSTSSSTFGSSSSSTSSSTTTGSTSSSSTSTTGSKEYPPLFAKEVRVIDKSSRFARTYQTPSIESVVGELLQFTGITKNTLKVMRVKSDSVSQTIEYYCVLNDTDIPLVGCSYSYTIMNDGSRIVSDETLNVTKPVDFRQNINSRDAGQIVMSILNEGERRRTTTPPIVTLVALPDYFTDARVLPRSSFKGAATICYRVEVNSWVYYISALDSHTVFHYSNNQTASANTYYDGNKNIDTLSHGGSYYLEDVPRASTVVDCDNGDCSTMYKQQDSDDSWTDSDQEIAAQVQWGVGKVLDYFSTVHGRNGLDGAGGPSSILSEDNSTVLLANKIHYQINANYAAWTGTDFVYGDGDGVNYGPMVSLDIIAHELSHAIVEFECNLDYYSESGALRESFGDITAAAVSYWTYGENSGTWTFGEDVYTPGVSGDAIRYMNEPSLADNKGLTINDDPDHTSEMYTGLLDNGGVHVNCGIPNKAFYLLAKGGSHSNGGVTMTGIGIEDAYAIWYRAVTVYFTSSTDFAGARLATLYACADLFGQGFKFLQVQTSWGLCGVGSVPTPNPTDFITNGGFEGTSNGWTLTGTGALYLRNSAEKRSGLGLVKLGMSNNYVGSVSQTFSIPNNAIKANLTFWLYITGSDSTTIIKDRLYIELRNGTSNVLVNQLAVYSNVDVTTGYVQKAFNLLAYANRPGMKLEFRVVNDGNAPTTFRLDDVAISTVYYKK